MAERKTFLFFCGWAKSLAEFSPEERCAIYDAIIAYAEDGTLPSLNPVAQMAFKFIKKDIDEMQSKYETICEKRREAANKRWRKQQSDTKASKSIQKHNLHYEHEHKHKHEHEHKHEQKEIDKSIPSATTNISRTGATAAASEFRVKIAELKSNSIWLEQMAMKFHITPDEVCRELDEFQEDMELRGKLVVYPQSLFVTWLGDRKYGSKSKSSTPTEPGLGIGEWRDDKGRRRYAHSDVIVPEQAPPRPSAAHYWNPTSGYWENMI